MTDWSFKDPPAFCDTVIKAVDNLHKSTGRRPTMWVCGSDVCQAIANAGRRPEMKRNDAYNKMMFFWGTVYGVEIWSHI